MAGNLNVPNTLTVARIAMVPLLAVLVLGDSETSLLAAAVFALAAITDCLDGHLARSRDLITDMGKLLDPIADKLLVGVCLVTLAMEDRVAYWVVGVVLARELAVTLLRGAAARRGLVMAAGPLGKLKMTVQIVVLLLLLVSPDVGHPVVVGAVWAMVALTIVSGIEAGAAVFKARRQAAIAPAPAA